MSDDLMSRVAKKLFDAGLPASDVTPSSDIVEEIEAELLDHDIHINLEAAIEEYMDSFGELTMGSQKEADNFFKMYMSGYIAGLTEGVASANGKITKVFSG